MISEVKRKSLPAIAKAVGLKNHQNLHHFRERISLDSPAVTKEAVGVNSQGTQ
jgi:SRSO17 transposase